MCKLMDRLILRSERGMTMLELLIAVVIASILGIGMMKIFSANTYLFRGEKTVSRTYTNARIVMDTLTRAIRTANMNPLEKGGGVFGVKQCAGTVGSAFTNNAIAAGTTGSLYFTRDYDENGTLDKNANEYVGYFWNTSAGACPDAGITTPCPNTLMVAVINPASGAISSWDYKFPNITSFVVDYQYADGTWASAAGMPDPSNALHAPNKIAAISITLTVRSEKPHELTKQYRYETLNSTLMLRNKYYP